jgi:nucleoside-diphosphate-sugar epimerase
LIVRQRTTAEPVFRRYKVQGEIFRLDLQDLAGIRPLWQKIKPSIIFNLAGYGVDRAERDEPSFYRINAQLVQTLCQSTAGLNDTQWPGQTIVHAGSSFEYGMIGGDLAENSTPNPTTLYGKSKLAGTQALTNYCQTHHLKGITVRLFTVYGPGEHQGRLLPSLINTARTAEPLPLTPGTQKRDFTYVEDVAEGLLRLGLAPAKPGAVINLATGRLTTVRQFVETAARITGIPNNRLHFGAIPYHYPEMDHANVALHTLQTLTAWTPGTTIETGIRKTVAFAENQP